MQKNIGKRIKRGYLSVLIVSPLIHRKESFVGIEVEVLFIVIGEIVCVMLVADDEHLHKTEQRIGISITSIIFVINNLLHGATWANVQGLQLNLNNWQAVNEQNDIITLKTVSCINSQLVYNLIIVFTPIFYIHQRILERRTVFSYESITLAQPF